jgi:outer membrane protein assembly factor BamD
MSMIHNTPMPRSIVPRALVAAALATALFVAPGCGGSAATGKVDYSVSAAQNYERGLEALERKDWIAGAKYFAFIRARFPYSKYATLAQLRLADAEFGAGNHLAAIDGYRQFLRFHPTHEMVENGYVSFRIGEAFVKMIPGDWWILPPAYEKDQSSTYDAERELRAFLAKSPYAGRASEMLASVNTRLAAHEWYVARFYWNRGRPMGTVMRLRRLLERYSGVGYDGDALWLLGKAYMKVDMPDRARTTWETLVSEHPQHDRASEARAELAKISG